MNITVGTRGSTLALSQTLLVVNELKSHHKNIHFEVKIIKTKGDINQTTPLHKMNDKGIFVKEIEQELINGTIDLAIHSMKDMPTQMDARLDFPVIGRREDPRDIIILRQGCNQENLANMPALRIGTGSKRRAYQFKNLYPLATILPIRGNIDTRIRKLQEENMDGIILAASGLKRIQRKGEISYSFSTEEMVPAPCQGMLALQTRKDDDFIKEILYPLEDREATIQYQAERAFLTEIQGGCHLPVGAYCTIIDRERIKLTGLFGNEDGSLLVRDHIEGSIHSASQIGIQLAQTLKKALEVKHG